ncbi:MAG: hypothetical protein OEU26_01375, partial [Candidatus Tectomicrobia bacterium]|nr:hypothetical protein [Candidatus Tectomicrobia bacterium]
MNCGFEITMEHAEQAEIRVFHPVTKDCQNTSFIDLAKDPASDTALVLMGQLYYREDLRARLPEVQALECTTDTELAL